MKKRIALILSFVLVLSLALCACGGESGSKKETLVGTWKASIDMSDYMNDMIAQEPEMAEYFHFDKLTFDLILELNEDGTCKMSADEASMEKLVDQMIAGLTEGMEDYLSAMLASHGIEMDLDAYLEMAGMSMDDLVGELKTEIMAEMDMEEFTAEGKYKAEDGKLYISDDPEAETDEYVLYTLKGDKLTLEQGTVEMDEGADILFPMELKRVK